MAFKLVCTQPFHGFEKGQEVTDPAEVERLLEDREHHFVRVNYEPPKAEVADGALVVHFDP